MSSKPLGQAKREAAAARANGSRAADGGGADNLDAVAAVLDQATPTPTTERAWRQQTGATVCPVRPLGHRDGQYHYLSPSGEHRVLSAREHNRIGLTSLFDGDLGWPQYTFPSYDQDGTPKEGTWSDQAVAAYLMRACAAEGLFDQSLPVRSLGVWRGHDGAPLVHAGDALGVPGAWEAAGAKRVEALYPAAPRIARPSDTPAGCDAGRRLLTSIRELWRFRDAAGPDLIAGWIASAMLGAYPEWRAHLYTSGERGSGKSWLCELVTAALGAQAQAALNNFTEAGLRQALTGEARALVLDESEHDEGGRVQRVIELLRHMSGGQGARTVRGTAGGRAQSFSVTGAAYLSSILPVPMRPQDRSRITLIRLDSLPRGHGAAGQADQAREAIRWAATVSPDLRSRVVQRAPTYLQLVRIYRDALLAMDCDARQADQLAALLAGRDLLTEDELPTTSAVDGSLDAVGDMIAATQADDEEAGEGQQCLAHLYSMPVDLWRSGERQTVSQVLMTAMDDTGGCDSRRVIQSIGLRIAGWGATEETRLMIANSHQGLEKIYRDTRWAGGVWVQALRYLPGASASDRPVRFAGVQARATVVPEALLPTDREDV